MNKTLTAAAGGAAALGLAAFAAREYRRNRSFGCTCYHLTVGPLPLPEPIRLLQVADLHGRMFGKGGRDLADMARVISPDLIVMTGDTVSADCKNLLPTARLLRVLCQIAPVFLIPGNHELRSGRWEEISQGFRSVGVIVLENERFDGEIKGTPLHILGLSEGLAVSRVDYLREFLGTMRHADCTAALSDLADCGGVRIVLSHFPELFAGIGRLSYRNFHFDLMLAGHAHGGQFRAGRFGVYAPGQGLFPRYTAGMHGWNPALVVSRGLGNDSPVPRVNNRPELVLVTLQ